MESQNVLLLALGNDILGDDGVGLAAARALGASGRSRCDIVESTEAGFALLDLMQGYRRVVIVDAMHTGDVPAGTMQEFTRADFARISAHSPHYVGLPELFALAGRLDLPFPEEVTILAVEIDDPWTLSEQLSPEIRESLPRVVGRLAELTDFSRAA